MVFTELVVNEVARFVDFFSSIFPAIAFIHLVQAVRIRLIHFFKKNYNSQEFNISSRQV